MRVNEWTPIVGMFYGYANYDKPLWWGIVNGSYHGLFVSGLIIAICYILNFIIA